MKSIDSKNSELSNEENADIWLSELLLFIGAFLTGTGLFLVHNESTYFVVLVAAGILCFGYSCLGYKRFRSIGKSENEQTG